MSALDSQKKLALGPVEMPPYQWFQDEQVALCKSSEEAMRMTLHLAPYSPKVVRAEAGISSSTMTRVMTGERMFRQGVDLQFYDACQNMFYVQWLAWQRGGRATARERTLSEENAALKARLAAYERLSA